MSYVNALKLLNDREREVYGEDFTHISAGGVSSTVKGVFEADDLQERMDNVLLVWFQTLDKVIARGDHICRGETTYKVLETNPDPGGGTIITIKDEEGIPQ